MEFFRIKHDIPFMRYAGITAVISAVTFILAIVAISVRGLNLSIDFTGGTVMEMHYERIADVQQIRMALEKSGYRDITVQNFGTTRDVLIRLPLQKGVSSSQQSQSVLSTLKSQDASVELRRVEFIGPQVGRELYESGGLALMLVCAGIMIYLAIRFEWRFSVAAIIANMHDVVIILGCFAFFRWEFSLTVLAGILTILGYSVNESVVVFDRIRENFRKMRKAPVAEVIDNAITRTMSRTIITHFMTQLMVLSMLLFGGQTLFYFAVALTIGILFGIYSSVLVSSPIVMWLGVSRENLMPVKKANADFNARP